MIKVKRLWIEGIGNLESTLETYYNDSSKEILDLKYLVNWDAVIRDVCENICLIIYREI